MVELIDYDKWGREIAKRSLHADAVSINLNKTSYVFCSNERVSCPQSAVTAITTSSDDVQAGYLLKSISYFDVIGREVQAASLTFDGRYSLVNTEYDSLGRVVRKSNPHFVGARSNEKSWARNYYDRMGRVLKILTPAGKTNKKEYAGFTTISKNAKEIVKKERANGFGELVEVLDDNNSSIQYSYHFDGELESITPMAHENTHPFLGDAVPGLCKQPTTRHQIVICYDRLGRKTMMWDPNKGLWKYEYNAFGEVIKQTNGNGHYSEITYDLLGREVSKSNYSAAGVLEGYTHNHYDHSDDAGIPKNNSLGKITATVYTEGSKEAKCENESYCERYTYDDIGRSWGTQYILPDHAVDLQPSGKRFFSNIEYGEFGRVSKITDPLNFLVKRNSSFITSGVQNHYNSFGFLEKITDLDGNQEIIQNKEYDALGNLKAAVLGGNLNATYSYSQLTGELMAQIVKNGTTKLQHNSYSWDEIGNLNHKKSWNHEITLNKVLEESYCYDNINRLIKVNSNTSSTANCPALRETNTSGFHFTYDDMGNILYKKDVGIYRYNGMLINGKYAGPNAVTTLLENQDVILNDYQYDNNGNLLTDGIRNFTYSTSDKPIRMQNGSSTTIYKYGAGGKRYYRKDNTSKGTETIRYIGNIEMVTRPDGKIEWRRSIPGGGQQIYTTSDIFVESAPKKQRWILVDHLGSTDVIVDQNSVKEHFSFDPWGERRTPYFWSSYSQQTKENFDNVDTHKGFTGHEMVDPMGVIHMNARIYDARLGRFLQADPVLPNPTDLQDFNRYSYVRNNPLNLTDPSGNHPVAVFVVVSVFSAGVGYMAQQTGYEWLTAASGLLCIGSANPVACGSAAAFGTTFGATGDFGQALKSGALSAVSSAAFMKIGDHFAKYHNDANPIKFGQYNLKPHQVAGQILAHGMVGGVVSELQGGKFGHGFSSAGLSKLIMGSLQQKIAGETDKNIRALMAGVIGGTTSVISGGKFANGAVTAAFAQMLNGDGGGERRRKEQEKEQEKLELQVSNAALAFGALDGFSKRVTGSNIPYLGKSMGALSGALEAKQFVHGAVVGGEAGTIIMLDAVIDGYFVAIGTYGGYPGLALSTFYGAMDNYGYFNAAGSFIADVLIEINYGAELRAVLGNHPPLVTPPPATQSSSAPIPWY